MLSDRLGIRLVLLIGKTVPLPASAEVTKALINLEVTNDAKGGDGFQMTFSLAKGIVEYSLLKGGKFSPGTRVVIAVLLGVRPEVLIDGIITHHQVKPSNEPGMSTLTVTGSDLSVMLDLKEKNERYPNQPDFVIFSRLIGAYGKYGLVPQPTPTKDVPIMVKLIPRQCDTDLKFIQKMAKRNGFVFYIEPVTIGVNKAYFGPEKRLGLPQPALSMNMGPSTNIDSLRFSQDGLAPVATKGSFLEPITKRRIPIPALPSLKLPPLARSATRAMRTSLLRDTSNKSAGKAATTAAAAVTNAPDAVTAEGEVESVRYGHVLRARKLVGVRGAGLSLDGFYYVQRVTHNIARGQYTQSFALSREGTGALSPFLRP
ncbi:MAG TPA: hypothetical protein VJU77_10715 [Chthoniobacterales bacterium]|nr:hypothetical protein [Chthoniobacterales bacterium]